MRKLQKLLSVGKSVSIIKFIYYNFFCNKILREKGCYLVPFRGAKVELHKTARIILKAHLILNSNKYPCSRAECYLRLCNGAEMTVTGNVKLHYNATVEVHNNGKLSIGRCPVINSGTVIICAYRMTIGSNCVIARNCLIMDSDHHQILNDDGATINHPREVIIGENVWVGAKSTILKGTKIESGSVIGANSLVAGHVNGKTLVRNEPAREFSKNNWSQKGFNND